MESRVFPKLKVFVSGANSEIVTPVPGGIMNFFLFLAPDTSDSGLGFSYGCCYASKVHHYLLCSHHYCPISSSWFTSKCFCCSHQHLPILHPILPLGEVCQIFLKVSEALQHFLNRLSTPNMDLRVFSLCHSQERATHCPTSAPLFFTLLGPWHALHRLTLTHSL